MTDTWDTLDAVARRLDRPVWAIRGLLTSLNVIDSDGLPGMGGLSLGLVRTHRLAGDVLLTVFDVDRTVRLISAARDVLKDRPGQVSCSCTLTSQREQGGERRDARTEDP